MKTGIELTYAVATITARPQPVKGIEKRRDGRAPRKLLLKRREFRQASRSRRHSRLASWEHAMRRKWSHTEKSMMPWFDADRSIGCAKWLKGKRTDKCVRTGWLQFIALPPLPERLAAIPGKENLRFQIAGIGNHARTRIIVGLQPSGIELPRADTPSGSRRRGPSPQASPSGRTPPP